MREDYGDLSATTVAVEPPVDDWKPEMIMMNLQRERESSRTMTRETAESRLK